jgi:hypothetical protein
MERNPISGLTNDNQRDQAAKQNTGERLTVDPTNNSGLEKEAENQGICIFDISSACVSPQTMQSILGLLNSVCKCAIVGPQDIGYEEAERIIRDRLTIK